MLGWIRRRGLAVAVACTGAFVAALAGGSDAYAAVVTQTQTKTQHTINSSFFVNFNMDKFDPALGTLISVRASMSGPGFTYKSQPFYNDSEVLETGTATFTPKVLLNASVFANDGLELEGFLGGPQTVSYSILPVPDGDNAVVDSFRLEDGVGPAYALSSAEITKSAVRAAYTGVGTKLLIGSLVSGFSFAPDPGTAQPVPVAFSGPQAEGDITMSVTYTYDAVPEPATAGLLAAGLALCRRRRR